MNAKNRKPMLRVNETLRLIRLLALLLSLTAAATTSAQNTGTLAGRVTEAAVGQGLPGVSVEIEGTSFSAATTIDGLFIFGALPVGSYRVRAYLGGYADTVLENVTVEAGRRTEVRFEMGEQPYRYSPCAHMPRRPVLDRDPFATRTIFGEKYCSGEIHLVDLPIER